MAKITMTEYELTAWSLFMSRHNMKGAKKIWIEHHSGGGIGIKTVAYAKYRFRTIKEDITDYASW